MALMRSWREAGIGSDSIDLDASIARSPWLRQGAGCIVVPCPERSGGDPRENQNSSYDGCRRTTIAVFAALDDIAPADGQSPPRAYADAAGACWWPATRQARTSYLAALTPAAAATPSCCPVPPLAPIAPMILPFTTIGMPPSDATGFSVKVVKAVLPAAY
jgi:hypothetical protein